MRFNKHSNLLGQHAFLSASKHHWVGYDDDKLARVFFTAMATQRGVELHELAFNLIRLGVKLPRSQKTLNMYVNDALGFRMTPEQVLYYSENCFGTADTISFRDNTLRISDLKTGVTPASEHQLEVYAALFCLEYDIKPHTIKLIELRIYQNDMCKIFTADPDDILHIMDKIIRFDKLIRGYKEEAV